ncbi:MAG TPA: hypothetical protein VF541_15655 [Longimicrobium sp.]|jgi:hypothetical protein
MSDRSERAAWPVRKGRIGDPEPDDYAHLTPEQRVGMMWELTQVTWAFMGEPDVDPTLQRHIARVVSR